MYYLTESEEAIHFKAADKKLLFSIIDRHNRILEEVSSLGFFKNLAGLQGDLTNELAIEGGFSCYHRSGRCEHKISTIYRRHFTKREVSVFLINLADSNTKNPQLDQLVSPERMFKLQSARIEFALRHHQEFLLRVSLADYKGKLPDNLISRLETHSNPEIRMLTKHLTLVSSANKHDDLYTERKRMSL